MGKKYTVEPFWQGEPKNSHDFMVLGNTFFTFLQISDYSQQTIQSYKIQLKSFVEWCYQRAIFTPGEVTTVTIEIYQSYLSRRVDPESQKPFTAGHRKNRLSIISHFFSWLKKNHHLLADPTENLEPIKVPKQLPHNTFTVSEVEKIMQQPKLTTHVGLRDRAILETIYSTGLRRFEIVKLAISDINFSRCTLSVREGKGRKDRVVPIGQRALYWIQKYLDESRPLLLIDPLEQLLFINMHGVSLHYQSISNKTTAYVKAANIGKPGSSHTLRHTMATLMLENGAEIRYLQEILGHSKLSTTEIYTRVSIAKLKEIHNRTHPAKMNPTKTQEIQEEIDPSDE
jgi:integrase/recombinase XerD